MDGRACVLRTICEVSELPLQHNGLVGELIHAIFTPGYASIKEDYMEEDYATAESNGRLPDAGCHQKYTGCPIGHGLLDLIAYVHH
ncbi:unnamed protein product [Timema podura]|uniref:Uncharacterized protein n=1 Tax=Timema podura TaxID=61482 RepID=A0ABN7PUX8_TIMPD|nr:unnamed protein product [Timema podura]